MSFPSTLYLYPVLDLLLANIPPEWHSEIRLGLQEALVNAAKHGNHLDPSKTVIVQFKVTEKEYSWVITDEGNGFAPQYRVRSSVEEYLPTEDSECGRGLCILYQVFDRVGWNRQGTQLKLCKLVKNGKKN